tara:strand:- start:196 stop:576 length:381 start_codon:yes stop_codon:yes gene_type:complete
MNYQLVNSTYEGADSSIKKTEVDGSVLSIPSDPANTDYREYLEWLAEGNTPLPVDSGQDPWTQIRSTRDQLISDSDWTMTPGATVDQAQWSAYRQKLRDLPQTYENAADVVWPTSPSASGPNTIEE